MRIAGPGRLGIAAGLLAVAVLAAPSPADVPRTEARPILSDHETRAPLDADVFFDQLVRRYRQLERYEDTAEVVQVTQREGESPERVETQIACGIEDGDLRVDTPARQLARTLGLSLPFRAGPVAEDWHRRYDLWLAPHLALRFAEEPLRGLREGVPEAFRATQADEVTIDDRSMVQVHLESPGMSEDVTASVDLFVNPESMLIERIESEHRMPDGANVQTTLVITPTLAENSKPAKPCHPCSLP